MNQPFNKLILAAVVVLALGEGYLLFQNAQLQHPTSSSQSVTSARTPTIPTSALTILSGTAQSADSSHLVLLSGSSSVSVVIDPSTTVVAQGALKDSAQQAADMEAFHQSSNALAKDPANNQLALETLVAPSPYIETPIHAADITAGSKVTVYGVIENGVPHAVEIMVL